MGEYRITSCGLFYKNRTGAKIAKKICICIYNPPPHTGRNMSLKIQVHTFKSTIVMTGILFASIAHSATADSISIPRKSSLKRLPPIAVLSFTGNGIDSKDLSSVTNRFESELLATDSFKIVERRNIDQILKEQGFQQSGACNNSDCSVEIGQLLSVQGIFTGELSKVGKIWSLSVKRTDVGSGLTQFSHVLDIEGKLDDVLRGGVPEMALIASCRKRPENNHTILVAKERNLWPWVISGIAVAGGATAAIILVTQDKSASTENVTPRNVSVTW